jgi:hypothetical protein
MPPNYSGQPVTYIAGWSRAVWALPSNTLGAAGNCTQLPDMSSPTQPLSFYCPRANIWFVLSTCRIHRRLVKRCVGIAKQHLGHDWAEHHPLAVNTSVTASLLLPVFQQNALYPVVARMQINCDCPRAACFAGWSSAVSWLSPSINSSAATVQLPHAVSFDANSQLPLHSIT